VATHVRAVWRKGPYVGVAFVGAPRILPQILGEPNALAPRPGRRRLIYRFPKPRGRRGGAKRLAGTV